ncbi:MAG: T9SS type A sorting domain-containing protein [Bacteroidales bacterium]|nr:T9SS type A sorting domain-containing protein [Bacteroidales bacterium]MCF8327598.1 T9SS type A sorting domain-containing protein [Bacteroidales bacterium]
MDANGKVDALGSLLSIGTSDWGSTGKSFQTTVFQRNSGDPVMKQDEDISKQTIHGVFITYAQLGINSNETMYGVSIFPGDVDNTMDLIDLSDVPNDTPTGSGGPGGLDMMGGGGYFGSEDVLVSDLQVDLSSNNMAPAEGDPIEITISINNNGPTINYNITSTTTIPDGYTFDGFVSGYTGSASQSSGTITMSFDPLGKDNNQTLTFTAIAEPSGDRTFTSDVSGDRTDVSPGNNSDNLTILLASDQEPYPVSLISFYAESHKKKNIISWTTASEINNDYFEIERSISGTDFKPIGIVNGHGTSNSVIDYEFRDHSPPREVVYYKLKQVDYDGTFEYFGPIAVNPAASEEKIKVYPNPAREKLYISGLNQDIILSIYNPNGQIMYQKTNPQQNMQVNLSHLSSGLYFLRIVYPDGKTKSQKISIE